MTIPLLVAIFCVGFAAGSLWQAFWTERNRREAEMLDELWDGDDLGWD